MRVQVPTVIIDKSIALRNIKRMAEKAKKNNLLLRPHFKTHQSIEVGEWFKYACIDMSRPSWFAHSAANTWGCNPNRAIDPVYGFTFAIIGEF